MPILIRHRRWVLLACLFLTGLSVAILPRLELRTSRSALSSEDDPEQKLFKEYLSEFGANAVVVVVEEGTEPQRQAFVDDMVERLLLEKGHVKDVFYRMPLGFFRERLLGLASATDLLDIYKALELEYPTLADLAASGGLADLNRFIHKRIEGEFKEGRRPEEEDLEGLRILLNLAQSEKRLIAEPAKTAAEIEKTDLIALVGMLDPSEERLVHQGYLTSTDGSLYVIMVHPQISSDSLDSPVFLEEFLSAIRRSGDAAQQSQPEVEYGLTGVPVTIVEESQTVNHDAPFCSILAAASIGILAMVAFRRKLAVLLVLFSLGCGILWNFGLTWLIFGGINLITSAVPVILLALGTDFGIHVVVAYEAERILGHPPSRSISEALQRVGPGMITGAITTALAFYAICFMEYRGFQEFGVTAGNGVLVCMVAMVVILPALLILTDRRPAKLKKAVLAPLVGEIVKEPPDLPPPSSSLRRSWHSTSRAFTAFPKFSLLLAVAVTGYFIYLAQGIGFDYRVEDLLPKDSESIITQEKLKNDPHLSPEFAVLFCKNREMLRASTKIAEEMAKEGNVLGRRDSILAVLPESATEVRKGLMDQIRKLLEPLTIDPGRMRPVDPKAIRKSLEELLAVFERALDMVATIPGTDEMVRLLDQMVTTLESAADAVEKADESWIAEFTDAQRRVWNWGRARLEEVDRMLAAGPVTEGELPKEILDHYKGPKTGQYVLYLYPAGSLEKRPILKKFVEDSREVARKAGTQATGYPIVFYASTELIHRGFSTAVSAAAIVILITLFLDFQRIGIVFLAVLPKVLGIIWMLGIMRLLGINYNLANQIVIPLIIGVGLAYGIHIIHRFIREKPKNRDITNVLEHTGAAITLSGLTTMIGFGSLALASHRGLASIGTVLFFGVGAALVASTYVLANLLYMVFRPKR